jgi:hypothetical protein
VRVRATIACIIIFCHEFTPQKPLLSQYKRTS